MLQQAGKRAGTQKHRPLLVALAEAVQKRLGQRGNIFAPQPQRRHGKADGGKPEGEVGQQQALAGHLA